MLSLNKTDKFIAEPSRANAIRLLGDPEESTTRKQRENAKSELEDARNNIEESVVERFKREAEEDLAQEIRLSQGKDPEEGTSIPEEDSILIQGTGDIEQPSSSPETSLSETVIDGIPVDPTDPILKMGKQVELFPGEFVDAFTALPKGTNIPKFSSTEEGQKAIDLFEGELIKKYGEDAVLRDAPINTNTGGLSGVTANKSPLSNKELVKLRALYVGRDNVEGLERVDAVANIVSQSPKGVATEEEVTEAVDRIFRQERGNEALIGRPTPINRNTQLKLAGQVYDAIASGPIDRREAADVSILEREGSNFEEAIRAIESRNPNIGDFRGIKSLVNQTIGIVKAATGGDLSSPETLPTGTSLEPIKTKTTNTSIRGDLLEDQTRANNSLGFVAPGVPIEKIASDIKGGIQAVKAFGKEFFTTAGLNPKSFHDARVLRDGRIRRGLAKLALVSKDFDKALRKAFEGIDVRASKFGRLSGTNLQPKLQRLISDVVHGKVVPKGELPKEVIIAAEVLRNEIDQLSRTLRNLGIAPGPVGIAISNNLGDKDHSGVYVNRAFKKFTTKKWHKNVPQEAVNRAHDFLMSEFKLDSDVEIKRKINLLLDAKGSPQEFMGSLSGKDRSLLGIFKKRKTKGEVLAGLGKRKVKDKLDDFENTDADRDIPEEIRDLWGEETSPIVEYAQTVAKQVEVIAQWQYLQDIRRVGFEGGILFESDKNGQPVNAPDDIRPTLTRTFDGTEALGLDPLKGVMTTPEVYDAFIKQYQAPSPLPGMLKLFLGVNGIVKSNKTIWSIMTHIRNALGNFAFQVANGNWNVSAADDTWKTMMAGFGKGDAAARETYLNLIERGVIGESVVFNELRDLANRAHGMDYAQWTKTREAELANFAVRNWSKFRDKVRAAYALEDDVHKMFAFFAEEKAYRKAMPDATQNEIEGIAAGIVRDTFPTYSNIPEAIRALRIFPTGTFVSFPSEVVRTGWKRLVLTSRELQDPRLRTRGAQRLAGQMIAVTATSALAEFSRQMIGLTKDEEEDMRRLMPHWQEFSEFFHIKTGTPGLFDYIDLGYTDPFTYLKQPIRAFLSGEDWEESITDSIHSFFDPYTSEEIMIEKIANIARNKKKQGGPVFNDEDAFLEKSEKILTHLWEAVEPGTLTSFNRIYKGYHGVTLDTGRKYDPKIETIATFSGHRRQQLEAGQALKFRTRDFNRNRAEATMVGTKEFTIKGDRSTEQIEEAFDRMEVSRRRVFDRFSQTARGVIRLGGSSEGVVKLIDSNGTSKEEAERLVVGQYEPYVLTNQKAEEIFNSPNGANRLRTVARKMFQAHGPDSLREGPTADFLLGLAGRVAAPLPRKSARETPQEFQARRRKRDAARAKASDMLQAIGVTKEDIGPLLDRDSREKGRSIGRTKALFNRFFN
jgi:hypothetical protein